MPKLHLAEMRLTVKAEADMRKLSGENNWPQRVSARRCGGTDDFLVTFIARGSWI